MKSAPKITHNWWMIFKHFPPEPHKLWKVYILSMCLTVVLFSAGALCAYGVHKSWTQEPTISCNTENCIKQSNYREYILKKEAETKDAAIERIKQLKMIRFIPEFKAFSQPWSWFETELNQLEKISKPWESKKSKKHKIHSVAKGFLLDITLIFSSFLFYLSMSRLITLHAKSTYKHFRFKDLSHDSIIGWASPMILIGIIIAATMITSELFTSVFATEKTWFGYNSFCVTPSAFIVKCIAFVFFGFVASTPFTVLWCLSRRDFIPNLDPLAPDGKFGAERYVEFLQTWTLWLILAPSALGIFFFRYVVEMETVFSPVRLLYGCGIGIVILFIVVRLITNAIILRFRCRDALVDQKLGEADRVPIDPTISFLGTDWWKLPAMITVSLTSIWALLEFIGLSKIIVSIIQAP